MSCASNIGVGPSLYGRGPVFLAMRGCGPLSPRGIGRGERGNYYYLPLGVLYVHYVFMFSSCVATRIKKKKGTKLSLGSLYQFCVDCDRLSCMHGGACKLRNDLTWSGLSILLGLEQRNFLFYFWSDLAFAITMKSCAKLK